jgi:AraC family transcriptional regulator of adaptative response/methylated-DNA-[protein]-cysteine methyltransferase
MQQRAHELDETGMWQAVMQRDRHYDGAFVLGVRTTGIYCRPSCPARKPKRENVLFFACVEDAQEAGFRACKRCRPDDDGEGVESVLVEQVCRYIDAHVEERLTLEHLAGQANLSASHFQRVFKQVMGITPRQYVEARRLDYLKSELKNGSSITQAMYDAGYSSSSRLYERAPEQLGMTPAAYRKGGKGMTIYYTLAESALGYLLVGATERGVCAVSLGDTPEQLVAELHADYPAAEIAHDPSHLGEWVNTLLDHLNGQQPHLELPLDVQATAFQWRVWQELQAIPYGETRSYSQIAAAIGNPKAVRAVGSACANNKVSLVIPCHRAVREDGNLGGYRWGLSRKEKLLQQEQHADEAV